MGAVLLRCSNDRIGRLLDTEVHNLISIVAQNNVDQILADIVNIAFHGREHNSALARAFYLLHLRFEVSHCLLHYAG